MAKGSAGWCIACRRRLTDPASRARAYGPVCAGRMKVRGGDGLFGTRVAGFFAEVAAGVIVVADQNPDRSAQQHGGWVVEQLRHEGFNLTLPVLYREQVGGWFWLRLMDRQPAGIVSLGVVDYAVARRDLWERTFGRG